MRTISDFRTLHATWHREVLRIKGIEPVHPYHDSPLEMTDQEFSRIEATYAYYLHNKPGQPRTLFGHPIKVVEEPADAIAIPDHA